MLARPITEMSARNLVVITQSVEKRSDCSQWICDEAGNVIEVHEHKGDCREPPNPFLFSSGGLLLLRISTMDSLEDDRTLVIRLDMARLRARFNVATDEEVEDILMEYGVL